VANGKHHHTHIAFFYREKAQVKDVAVTKEKAIGAYAKSRQMHLGESPFRARA
jgi:hypothetical protein